MFKKKQILDCRKVYCSPFFETEVKQIKQPKLQISEEINTKQRKHPNELQLEIPLSKKFKFQRG
jgi:hypothetical protein